MDRDDLKTTLDIHRLWVEGKGGVRACLLGADLRGAYLLGAYLLGANLREADLQGAYLQGANLQGANLLGADLRGAYLQGANLQGAYLRGACLLGADLRGANLLGANLPRFQITPKGYPLIGFKKLLGGPVCTIEIPAEAERTASLVGRKCRAEYVRVLSGGGISNHDGRTKYVAGRMVYPDKYDPDIRVECTSGIHFFLTPEEAEEY